MNTKIVTQTLVEYEAMTDLELLKQRTMIENAYEAIKSQLETEGLDADPTWRKSATAAKGYFRTALTNIKNILAERRNSLGEWKKAVDELYDAARAYIESDFQDEDADFDRLEKAVREFPVPFRYREAS